MSWDIVYTAKARRDLRNIYEYIAYDLLAGNSGRADATHYEKHPVLGLDADAVSAL